MKIIILPGYSVKNFLWAQEVKNNLHDGSEIILHKWSHWQGNGNFSINNEISQIKNYFDKQTSINLIAKSIGTLVASHLINKNANLFNKVILCGIPLNDLSSKEIQNYQALSRINLNHIVCFQNENDPHGSFIQVQKLLSSINPQIKLVSKPGSTHDYPYYEEFENFLSS